MRVLRLDPIEVAGVRAALLAMIIVGSGCLDAEPVDEGVAQSAIYGGTTQSAVNYPWVVDICEDVSGVPVTNCFTSSNRCQGVLIQAQYVLTSTNCANPYTGATIGYKRSAGNYEDETQHLGGLFAYDFDVVMIKLPAPFADPNHYLVPAELPISHVAVGNSGIVASGHPSQTTVGVSTPSITALSSDQFTASSSSSSLCAGDVGSGLISQSGGFNYVQGVVFTAPGSCNANNVAWTGVSVMKHLPFIVSSMSGTGLTGQFNDLAGLYGTGLDYGIPSNWESVSGDFNGDGKTDYLRLGDTGAWLYRGSAAGTFTESFFNFSGLSFGQPSSWKTIVGNFDGTGSACTTCMDFARLGDTGAWIWYGNADGTFTLAFQDYGGLNFGVPSPYQTAVGDFDGDGRTDYGRLSGTGVFWYYGNTNKTFTGTFQTYQAGYDFGTPSSFQLVVGDFNGDGRADYGRADGTSVYWYWGAAGRTFTASRQIYSGLDFGFPSTWETIVGNFNGDSRADYARIGATGAWVWYGAAGNTFTQTFYSYGGSNFGQPSNYKTIVGDFNGDTRTDYARLGDDVAYFYMGTATAGSWTTLIQSYKRHYGTPSSFSTVTGDFNGDGRIDYARLGGVFQQYYLHQ